MNRNILFLLTIFFYFGSLFGISHLDFLGDWLFFHVTVCILFLTPDFTRMIKMAIIVFVNRPLLEPVLILISTVTPSQTIRQDLSWAGPCSVPGQ